MSQWFAGSAHGFQSGGAVIVEECVGELRIKPAALIEVETYNDDQIAAWDRQIGQRIRTVKHSLSMPIARQPTSPIHEMKLLNEARESTERIIYDLCSQHSTFRKHKPRYDRGWLGVLFSM